MDDEEVFVVCEYAEGLDGIAVIGPIVVLNHRVTSVDLNVLLVMRKKGDYDHAVEGLDLFPLLLPVDLLFGPETGSTLDIDSHERCVCLPKPRSTAL